MGCPSHNKMVPLPQVDGNSNLLHHTLLMLEPEGKKKRYYEKENFKFTKYLLILPQHYF